jgi:hypothetical protein
MEGEALHHSCPPVIARIPRSRETKQTKASSQNPRIVILSRAKNPSAYLNPDGSFAGLKMTGGGAGGLRDESRREGILQTGRSWIAAGLTMTN